MNYSKILLFCVISLLLAFSSCKKDEISEIEDVIEQVEVDSSTTNPLVSQMQSSMVLTDGLELGCFSVDFPFDLIIDGTTYTINSIDDFDIALSDEPEVMDFVYPFDITYADGTTDTITDGAALGDAFASCIPDEGWEEDVFPAFLITELNSCYEMGYPVNLVDEEGNILIANNEDELVDLMANNYHLIFQFPLNLIDEDGNNLTANDDDELFQLLMDCEEINNPGIDDPFFYGCWEYVFPFDMIDQDGNIVVINNHDDMCNAVLNGLILEYVFPLTLINALDGEELVINNMADLDAAWLDCEGGPGELRTELFLFLLTSDLFGADEACFSINYPLSYPHIEEGETNSLDDSAAAQAYLDSTPNAFDEVDFPVTVTEIATGNQVSFEDDLAFFTYLDGCN